MTGVIDSMKAVKKQMDDQVIASDMLMGLKAAATGYFMAAMESPTPELRSMFRGAMSQNIDEYSSLMDLAINRGWFKPYDMPDQQLTESYRQSQTVVSYREA